MTVLGAAFASTCAGAVCLYLGAPRQQWLSRSWPALPSRIGGGGLMLLGCLLWWRELHPATAIFTTLTVSMVLFIVFPYAAALSTLLRKK